MLSGWRSIPWGFGEGSKGNRPVLAVPVVACYTGFSSSPISEMLSKPCRSPLELAIGLFSPLTTKSPDPASPVPTHGQWRQPILLSTLLGPPSSCAGHAVSLKHSLPTQLLRSSQIVLGLCHGLCLWTSHRLSVCLLFGLC